MFKKIANAIDELQRTAGRECELLFRLEHNGLLVKVRIPSIRRKIGKSIEELPELDLGHIIGWTDIANSNYEEDYFFVRFMAELKSNLEKYKKD